MLCRMLALLIAITSKEWPAGFEYWHMCDSCVQRHGRLFPLPNTFLSPSWVPPCLVEAQRLGVLALFSHPTKRQKIQRKKERKTLVLIFGTVSNIHFLHFFCPLTWRHIIIRATIMWELLKEKLLFLYGDAISSLPYLTAVCLLCQKTSFFLSITMPSTAGCCLLAKYCLCLLDCLSYFSTISRLVFL